MTYLRSFRVEYKAIKQKNQYPFSLKYKDNFPDTTEGDSKFSGVLSHKMQKTYLFPVPS